MNDLREQVQKVISDTWPQFEKAHPHLAEALDQTVLADQISKSLADDPEFQTAMVRAEAVGQSAQTILEWTQRAVDLILNLHLSPE